jgi:hypothetical protein
MTFHIVIKHPDKWESILTDTELDLDSITGLEEYMSSMPLGSVLISWKRVGTE